MDLNEGIQFTSSVTKPLPLLVETSPVSTIQIDRAKVMHIKKYSLLKFTHSPMSDKPVESNNDADVIMEEDVPSPVNTIDVKIDKVKGEHLKKLFYFYTFT